MADPSTCPPLTPASIAEAHEKIKPYIHETPLIASKTMNAIASHPKPSSFLTSTPPAPSQPALATTSPPLPLFNLYFKLESQQKIGAFKARGAHHALLRLISTVGLTHLQTHGGVTTHSSGNHAQALALAAHTFNVPSHIVMPRISTPSKIAGTRVYCDDVVFCGSTAAEREEVASEVVKRTGAVLVPPYDHPDIVLGQGTVGREMEGQFREMRKEELRYANGNDISAEDEEPRFDAVITPLGGGGLLSGTATWFSHTSAPSSTSTTPQKRTLIFGAEPSFSGANDAQLGLASTPPTRIPHVSSLTIADGLRTPVGVLPWSIISDRTKVEGVYSVSEEQITDTMRLMMERVKVWVEPSAVVGVAVVLFCEEFRRMVAGLQAREREETGKVRPWDVGVVISGGNVTVEAVAKLFGQKLEGKGGNGTAKGERETGEVGMDGRRVAEDVAG